MHTTDIQCSECRDMISVHVARIVEDDSFDNGMETCRYLCPVCAILAKNALMHAEMLARQY